MIEKLLALQKNSYVPITGYHTSSIVVMKDGEMFEGVNVENPSFRDGICAEQNAIANAISHGYKKGDFALLYVMTDGDKPSTPCFLCRQVINELIENKVPVICYDKKGDVVIYDVGKLCPHPFDESDLV